MVNYRQSYEVPVTIVIAVKTEFGILTLSDERTNASRSGYGAANSETWE